MIIHFVRREWLKFRIRHLMRQAGAELGKNGDVLMLKAMIGTKAEREAIDLAALIVHEALNDPRYNGPWRVGARPMARAAIKGMFLQTFPDLFVEQVFEAVDLMEPAK